MSEVKVEYRAGGYDWTEWRTVEEWAALLDALLRERGLQAIPKSYEAHTIEPYWEYYWGGWGPDPDNEEEITIYAPPVPKEPTDG